MVSTARQLDARKVKRPYSWTRKDLALKMEVLRAHRTPLRLLHQCWAVTTAVITYSEPLLLPTFPPDTTRTIHHYTIPGPSIASPPLRLTRTIGEHIYTNMDRKLLQLPRDITVRPAPCACMGSTAWTWFTTPPVRDPHTRSVCAVRDEVSYWNKDFF